MINHDFDLVIVGGGPVGLLACLVLADSNLSIALITKQAPVDIGRTVALMKPNIDFMKAYDLLAPLENEIAPLKKLRIVDATQHLIKAPTVTFSSQEIDLTEFGFNIPNRALINVLGKKIKTKNIKTYHCSVEKINIENGFVELCSENENIRAKYVIAADGKNSKLREAAAINIKKWSYNQQAITTIFNHTEEHDYISTEFQTEDGPLTFVPLPGKKSSLVCVMKNENAAAILNLSDDHFCRYIEKKTQNLLGNLHITVPRQSWNMEGLTPEIFAKNNIFLAGEAAHVFPPIGAQGLNLGFRDIAALKQIFVDKSGNDKANDVYNQLRSKDIKQRTSLIDYANKSLLAPSPLSHLPRKLGLLAAQKIPSIRREMMRFGLGLNDKAMNLSA